MKKVIVLISDKNYLEHCKSLFYSIRNIGRWSDDLCLIVNDVDDSELFDFVKFGVKIIHKKSINSYYAKYFLFDEIMKYWDYIVYMDCDFTILGNLYNIFDSENLDNSLILVDKEPFLKYQYFCQGWDENVKKETLSNLKLKFDLDKFGFNTGFMSFNSSLIKENTLSDILKLSRELQFINNHTTPEGTEQPILNLYFENDITYVVENKVCFWKDLAEKTIALHHCRWEAPWKNNDMCSILNMTYQENYLYNLNKFYTTVK